MIHRSELIIFRRVVVGFQGPPDSLASLEIAAEMAQRLRSELSGVFFKDQGLIDWCASGIVRHVSSLGAGPVAPEALIRDLDAAAALARTRLARVAQALGLNARFEVSGAEPMDPEITGPDDLLVVIEPSDPSARHSHPFSGMLQRIATAAVPVLYVPHGARMRRGPVIALASTQEDGVVQLAARIARQFGEEMVRIEAGESEEWIRVSPPDERLLVLDRRSPLLHDIQALTTLLAGRKAPALIVGTAGLEKDGCDDHRLG